MHCHHYRPLPLSRRDWLLQSANGFGAVALTSLLAEQSAKAVNAPASGPPVPYSPPDPRRPLAPRSPGHRATAKSVIFLYMDGGPSHVDTFDPKPRLAKENGEPFKLKVRATQFDNIGRTLMSPWKFRNYGESGLPISDLFPHLGTHCADDLCVVRSMTSNFSEHTFANYFLHTGHGLSGRPSMGAWVGYGLGTECQNLPAFVILNGGQIPPGGLDCFHNGFLPATYQGSVFKPGETPVSDIRPTAGGATRQQRKLALLDRLDWASRQLHGPNDSIDAAIRNYELGFRMQSAVPDLVDLSGETAATRAMYGIDDPFPQTSVYARQCLLARRLVERGVRFIQLTCPPPQADRWDQHGNLKDGHEKNARAVDRPIAALLRDLKQRGLLDSTLVIWSGEFGRTPMAQGANGRDHNPFGFSIWLAGGGIRPGMTYGATDEYGYSAIENKLQIHDLHATMLHLLGLDHTRLTIRYSGRDMRLTDVHGHVIHPIIG